MDSLLDVLLEARRLAVDDPALVAEIDGYVAQLRRREEPSVGILFLPTGPLQELSLEMRWGGEFLALADRYDAVIAAALECPTCSRRYLREHWATWNEFDDDGWHDSFRGRCPRGHERMLED